MPFPLSLLNPPPPTDGLVSHNPAAPAPQEEDIAAVIAHFNKPGFELPIGETDQASAVKDGKNKSKVANGVDIEKTAPLTEREMMFLSRETVIRFLRATKTGPEATINRLERAVVWRRSARIDDIEERAREAEDEMTMGKAIVMDFAPNGMPIMYFFPQRNTRAIEHRKVVHALFMLERAMDLMADGVTQTLVVFNFGGKRKGPPNSASSARETLNVLGEFYPELLGHAIIQEMPWMIRAFVTLMWPFVDPYTKSKIKFYSGEEAVAAGEVTAETFLKECGGKYDLPYDYETYWPALLKTCMARRAEHERRWRALGPPQVGREEKLFKVGLPRAEDVVNS